MAEQEVGTPKKIPVELVVSPDLGLIYSNFVTVHATEHEFILTFAVTKPEDRQGDKASARALARIVVPHHLLERIIRALTTTLNQFEEARRSGLIGEPEKAAQEKKQ